MSECANGTSNGSAGEKVPILTAGPALQTRFNTLANYFRSRFNQEPLFFVRVPGRVNLIGEHVDYCGYSVCPMAIEQDILVAVAIPKEDKLSLINFDPQYEPFQCDFKEIGKWIEDTDAGPAWYKYFLCGVKGALEVIPESSRPAGMIATVMGDIPPNAGLSSSSALVSSAVLATVHISQYPLSKSEMATLSAKVERLIGTEGGGMDQAIAFLGTPGCAKLIDFNPLRTTDVSLPSNANFVIAHSLVFHNKAATSDYNLRVGECRLAAQIIAKKRNEKWEGIRKLVDVQRMLGKSTEEMVAVAMTDLREEPYTLEEICKVLETTEQRLRTTSFATTFSAAQTFKLKQRALHVFQEASRVEQFCRVNENEEMDETEKLRVLGGLMSKSHASLKTLYECSHPEVDALVDNAVECGAFGARLTGAGWGGCVVAITTKNEVYNFVDRLKDKFYCDRDLRGYHLKNLVFPTEPNQGAAIYKVI